MDAAFDRLTPIQKDNVNKQMFVFAYECIAKSKGNPEVLQQIVDEETTNYPHLKQDLIRYCRLVESVR
jgi:hypothetical protein